ncbi:MAG TPA: hypothetical protein VK760_03780, partial [Candidatus Acidoferrales bacterium]|nr:hypothetical protein [Candidatus Acidoferrales bacterium]
MALTLVAGICACSQSVPDASRASIGDWESGTPVAGHPNAFKLSTGEIVEVPRDATPSKSCGFVGDVPPKCSNTGAFRRFYSQPNVSFIESTWDVSPSTNLPTPPPAKPPAAGYVYVEGWPVSNLNALTTAGFAYTAHKAWFYAYLGTP